MTSAHTTSTVTVARPGDLDIAAVRAIAAGASVELTAPLIERIAARRRTALTMFAEGADVYGVTTGMGALSGTRLPESEQADHSRRLLLGRAVGGPPWFDSAETRALIAVRLRTFLTGDAAVSSELCVWLTELLDYNALLPQVPRSGSGAAGEILPLAHAWQHLAGTGAQAAEAERLGAPRLGPKEGLALIAGVPVATALALLRAAELERLVEQSLTVAAAAITLVGANREPYEAGVARGDAELADVLGRLREYAGSAAAVADTRADARHLQAPVSFRVVGPVLAHLRRAAAQLADTADRAMCGVGDSPALLDTSTGTQFVGTPGFHGLDLAAAFDFARGAVVHAAAVATARMNRMLDARFTGLPAQLSAAPGPMAGLTPLHKWAVARVHEVTGWPHTYASPVETSGGQEDVQTFALEAAEKLRLTLEVLQEVLACELLAVHQGRSFDRERFDAHHVPGHARLEECLSEVAALLPADTGDRPWGRDVQRLTDLFAGGWGTR